MTDKKLLVSKLWKTMFLKMTGIGIKSAKLVDQVELGVNKSFQQSLSKH